MNPRVLYRAAAYGDARSIADSTISALSPAAWYHMRGSGVPTSSGGFASMWPDMADTDNGLVCPGVSGNNASTPNAAPLNVGSTSLEIVARVSVDDWTPSAQRIITNKNLAGNYTHRLSVSASGTVGGLRYDAYVSAANISAISSAAVGFSDGEIGWVRVVHTFASGAVAFYKASDSTTVPTSWTQVGTTQTITAGTPTDVAGTFEFGADIGGTFNQIEIYRVLVYKDTALALDADFSAQAKGTTSFTESSSNAATVTVNQSGALPAHIGNKKDLLQGTGTNQPAYSAGVLTFDGVDNYLKTNAFTLNQPTTVYFVGNPVSWTNGDVIFGSQSGTTAYVRQDTSTPQIEAYAGTASTNDSNFAVGSYAVLSVVFNGANSVLQVNANSAVTGDFGAGVLGGLTLGAAATPASYFNGAFKEAIVFAAAHDDATRTSVISALNTLNTVF